MPNAINIEINGLTELLKDLLMEIKTISGTLKEIRKETQEPSQNEDYDREFLSANQFCLRNNIGRSTLIKKVAEGVIEVDERFGPKSLMTHVSSISNLFNI